MSLTHPGRVRTPSSEIPWGTFPVRVKMTHPSAKWICRICGGLIRKGQAYRSQDSTKVAHALCVSADGDL